MTIEYVPGNQFTQTLLWARILSHLNDEPGGHVEVIAREHKPVWIMQQVERNQLGKKVVFLHAKHG
jgi:hypothetical protein